MFNRIRKVLNSHEIINILMLSYTIILIIPFLAGIISFTIGNNIIKNHTKENAMYYSNQTCVQFDTSVKDCTYILEQLYLDTEYKTLCDNINRNNDMMSMKKLSTKLAQVMYNKNIEDIIVFPYNSEYAIFSGGFYPKKLYYTSHITDDEISYEMFDEYTKARDDSHFYNMKNSGCFIYSEKFPSFTQNSPARIFFIVDYKNMLSSQVMEGNNFIVYHNNDIIASAFNPEPEHIEYIGMLSQSDEKNITHDNVFITASTSESNNLNYYYLTDMRSVSASRKKYSYVSIILFFSALIIGAALLRFFVKLHYEPINKFIKHIKSQFATSNSVYSYEFIEKNIYNLESEISTQAEANLTLNALLSSMQLSQWLNYNEKPDEPEKILPLDDDLKYAVLLVGFEPPEILFFEYAPNDLEQNTRIANFILVNIISEFLENNFNSYKMIEFEDSIAAIVVFDRKFDYKSCLDNILLQTSQTVRKEFNLEPLYSYSPAYESHDMLHQAYKEATSILQKNKPNQNVTGFDRETSVSKTKKNPIQAKHVHLLSHYILSGDKDLAHKLIDQTLTDVEDFASQSYQKYALATLVYAINDVVLDSGTSPESEAQTFISTYAPIDTIMTTNNHNEAIDALTNYCDAACDYLSSIDNNAVSISDRAKSYMLENYSNSQLTSGTVANTVGLSRDYFLKVFKQQTGISMADYLNEIRIKKACEIIKTEKSSLQDIATKVGYTNTKTFTRAFTKIIGITPGKYL